MRAVGAALIRLALAFALAVALACRGEAGSPAPTRSIVPWTSAPPVALLSPTPSPEPKPQGVRPCRTSDLVARHQGGQGATASMVHTVGIGNSSGTRCLLEGVPEVVFVDSAGRPLLTSRAMDPLDLWRGWAVLEPGLGSLPGPPERSQSGQAVVGILWDNWCEDEPAAALWLRFAADPEPLVARGDPSSPLRGGRCDVPGSRSYASVWPVAPAPAPEATRPPLSPPLAATIDAPSAARRGQMLTYFVTLSNVSDRAVSFDACPFYLESISPQALPTPTPPPGKEYGEPPRFIGGAKETYALNCDGLRPLAPGDAVTFELRILVPPDSRPGTTSLHWDLARLEGELLLGGRSVRAGAKLTIVP